MPETKKDLQKMERAIVRLRNKQNRSDLDYTVQISISSVDPGIVRFAAQLTAPAQGLQPVTFIGDSAVEITEQIKEYTKTFDDKKIEKAYHAAQIKACNRTIKFHEERIDAIDNPTEEDVDDGKKSAE